MNITVYLGANEGNDPSLRKAVRELGTWIGESGKRPCARWAVSSARAATPLSTAGRKTA